MCQTKQKSNDWEYGLCDCYQQPIFCVFTLFCPCFALASVATRSKMSECCQSIPCCLQWLVYIIVFFIPFGSNFLLAISRACVGNRYDIKPYFPCSNLCINICCPWCSLCQIHNELQYQNKKHSAELDFVEENLDVVVIEPVGLVEEVNAFGRKYFVVTKEPTATASPPECIK